MKKFLKWLGLGFLALLLFGVGVGFWGMGEVRGLTIGAVDMARVPDGAYEGEYKAGRFNCKVRVDVEQGRMTDVEVLKGAMGREGVFQALEERVIQEQTPALDAVSGATLDAKTYLKAVEIALAGAAK